MRVKRFLASPMLWLALSVTALVVALGYALLPFLFTGGDDAVPLYTVERSHFAREVVAEGMLQASQSTLLNAPRQRGAPVKIAWLVEDGSRVEAGDVIARFDPSDMEMRLIEGEADLATADSMITKRETQTAADSKNLERDANLARYELDMARAFQSKDTEIFSRVEIIESQIDENLAAGRLEHAQESRSTKQMLSRTDLELLAIDRRKATRKVIEAEQGLSSMEMRAPHDGITVFKRNWRGEIKKVGDLVMRGETLAEIPSLDEMVAEVFVLEADAGGLAENLEAQVVLEANPDLSYPATIRHVDKLPKPRLRGVPLQFFAVVLELRKTDPGVMKPGQRVRATLLLDARQDALVIPRQAVIQKEGGKVVYRRDAGGFTAVPVTLGPSSLGRSVVLAGLQEGDVIALRDPALSKDSYLLPGDEEDESSGATP